VGKVLSNGETNRPGKNYWKGLLESLAYKGEGVGRRKEFGVKKRRSGGGEKGTPAIKTPVGSFLRSLAAAKF